MKARASCKYIITTNVAQFQAQDKMVARPGRASDSAPWQFDLSSFCTAEVEHQAWSCCVDSADLVHSVQPERRSETSESQWRTQQVLCAEQVERELPETAGWFLAAWVPHCQKLQADLWRHPFPTVGPALVVVMFAQHFTVQFSKLKWSRLLQRHNDWRQVLSLVKQRENKLVLRIAI